MAAGCRGGQRLHPRASGTSSAGLNSRIFRDVAAEAGIDFAWSHGGRSLLDIQETIGHGCTFIDFDQDGLLDVLLVGNERCALYRNAGNGRFVDVSAQSGLDAKGKLAGVAVGDYDNDGFPDVCITGYGCCRLYHNRAHGSGPAFEEVTARAGVGARGPYDFVSVAAFVDLDGDGRLDLIAGRYIKFTPSSTRFCKYGDVEASCRVSYYDPDLPVVYRNEGGGKFSDATRAWGFDTLQGRCLGLAIRSGLDGRGQAVYFANDELPADLMVRKDGRYVNIGQESGTAYGKQGMRQAGMGCDWGDVDNDGKLDLVVATFTNEPKSLYRCDGPDTYSDVAGTLGLNYATAPYIAWTAKFLDFDNDGWPDLFITNGHVQANVDKLDPAQSYSQPLQLFHNEQGTRLALVSDRAGLGSIVERGASVGDFDNDGRPDILVVNEEGRALLLHNESKSANHWVGVRLVGRRCNRDAIGAKVLVSAGGRTFVRDEQLCGGYFSGQDPRLLFGLGSAAAIDKIEVRWPNGRIDRIEGAEARSKVDTYVTIVEGGGQ